MVRARVIPCLQLIEDSLVKTTKFKAPVYIGDPVNTVRIFNELEVDELCFLDIRATIRNQEPNFNILHQIADECFMPLSYGGGIKDISTAKKILSIGFEKIVINTSAILNPGFITELADYFGSQSIIVSIDVNRSFWGNYNTYSHDGTRNSKLNVVEWAKKAADLGAGELLITSMNQEGTWGGYDFELIRSITEAVNLPVIANGGAGTLDHIGEVVNYSHASAAALGSMVVFQQKDLGVLVNYPHNNEIKNCLKGASS